MAQLPFLKDFNKKLAGYSNVSTDFSPPVYWFSTGNYAINRILSGHYLRGIPQGRVTLIAGPSDSGKSFTVCNIMRGAQADGAIILAIDSEGALDLDYLKRVGVDTTSEKFIPVSVVTISDVVSVVSDFIIGYEKEYGKRNREAPKVVIVLDSLDMLITDAEAEHFAKGEQKGDQGQRAKQLKAFLRTTVARIKSLNISMVATHQVYPGDPLKGEGVWAINNAIRYSCSQIAVVTRLKLKEEGEVIGIRMRVETFKSRFAKLGSQVEVRVPYYEGMDPHSGLIDMLLTDGVITQGGAWYQCQLPDELLKFQQKQLDHGLVMKLFKHPKLLQDEQKFEELQLTPEVVTEPEAA